MIFAIIQDWLSCVFTSYQQYSSNECETRYTFRKLMVLNIICLYIYLLFSSTSKKLYMFFDKFK